MRYFSLVAGICLLLLILFLVAVLAGLPFVESTSWMSAYAAPTAAALGNILLVADVLLPVPSSLLMIANGALLGPFWGSVATLVSATSGGLLAFWLGRKGTGAVSRFVGAKDIERADRFFRRWGGAAVVMSRPIPIVAEAVGALAGTTQMGWSRYTLALILGNAPIAVLYALAGASVNQIQNGLIIFFALLAAAALWLLVNRMRESRRSRGTHSVGQ